MTEAHTARLYWNEGSAEAARCRHEIAHARYELGGNEQLRFHVPTAEGHDDYLISPAPCVHAASLAAPPPISAVIPSRREPEERW